MRSNLCHGKQLMIIHAGICVYARKRKSQSKAAFQAFFFFFAVASVLDAELLRSRRGLFSTSLTSGYESELAISTETVLIVTCVRGYFPHT